MTSDVGIWHAGSTWHYMGQVQRSRSQLKLHGHSRGEILLKWSLRPPARAFELCNAMHVCHS